MLFDELDIHVNPERSFGGTNGSHRAKRANFGRGVRGGPPPVIFKKPTLQMVQSTLFLSYICEYSLGFPWVLRSCSKVY